jgi:antitoxin (DNA-binding transcriptional repressor) of toxin-antitoxin stability system
LSRQELLGPRAVGMRKVGASSFKMICLAVMDEVQAKHETVEITKHGKPVAKLALVNTEAGEIYNFLAGKCSVTENVVSPAISPKECGDRK